MSITDDKLYHYITFMLFLYNYTGIENFAEIQNVQEFDLELSIGQYDYANCAGHYNRLSMGTIRDRYIYRNGEQKRIMFFSGSRWVIASEDYYTQAFNGEIEGFYSSAANECEPYETSWAPRYTVKL